MANTRRFSAFDYKPPSYDEATRFTSEKRTSTFDSIVKSNGARFFKPRQGENTIRILPPSWEGARHYSYEVWVHNEVGPDKQQYLCLAQNDRSPEKNCPLCDERHNPRLSQKDIDTLRPRPRNYIYLIDRSNENEGVLIWSISNQSDKEILSQSLIRRTQEYLPIVHPLDGYDIEFTRDGQGINTRYRGFKVMREPSPLCEDRDRLEEWIKLIDDNPIPDILQFFSASHIRNVWHGKAGMDEEESEVRYRTRDRAPIQNGDDDDPPFETEEEDPPPRRRPPVGEQSRTSSGEGVRPPDPEQRENLRRRLRENGGR